MAWDLLLVAPNRRKGAGEAMNLDRQRGGFSLIELIVVVAMVAALVGAGAYKTRSLLANQRVRAAARSVADILMVARVEAIRTRVNHIVFFDSDAGGNALSEPSGNPVAVLLSRDDNGDGAPQAGEYVTSVPFDASNSLAWGSARAALESPPVAAPEDNAGADFPESGDFACCTFLKPNGDPAHWLVLLPDGTPRAFRVGPFANGAVASGSGAVYVTNGERDYAVVMAALGGVRVHAWDTGAGAWRQ